MKDLFLILYRKSVRSLLHIFFILPIRKKRIVFCSYNNGSGYTCNPKYVCEYLKRWESGEYELIWAFGEPKKWKRIRGIRCVKLHSFRWLLCMLTARVIVYNRNPESYLPKRKGQLVINTWHAGGAYKKVGFENTTLGLLDRWRAKQINDYVDLFLSSSEGFTKSNIEGYHYEGEVMNTGMPRNDPFFRPAIVARIRSKVRAQYHTPDDSIVVLYAPTYRRNVTDPKRRSAVFPHALVRDALTVRHEGADVRIWRREHHQDTNRYGEVPEGVTDCSAYPDMQDLLCACDILITDYSSSIWDFAILKKPCFLYVPDLRDYEEEDRGFFTPIEEWPGILCRSDDELKDALLQYDEKECARKAEAHLAALGSYEDGHAAARICERIHEETH